MKFLVPALALTTLMLSPVAASSLPFVGKWDCGVASFTFTPRTYHNGSKTLRIKSIELGAPGDYLLTFTDGYSIALMNITKRAMTWSSPSSGDSFDCKRIR